MNLSELSPSRVMIAGDWHGNARWGMYQLLNGVRELEEPRVILQLGDFGIWPGQAGTEYLRALYAALLKRDAYLFFLDGNHEHHHHLAEYGLGAAPGVPVPIPMPPIAGETPPPVRIFWLPRGCRWQWHGRTWLALGGAASVDRAVRRENETWFREEEITPEQAASVISGGPADVMLTHECPRRVTVTLPLGRPMRGWDMGPSREHQYLLDGIVGGVRPSFLFHGHMHLAHEGVFPYPHGEVRVTGLDCDGMRGNLGIWDVRDMMRVQEP